MKLTIKEAEEARRRGQAYEHSMAIEGIHLTREEKALIEEADRRRMGYDDGLRFAKDWLRNKGIIPGSVTAAE